MQKYLYGLGQSFTSCDTIAPTALALFAKAGLEGPELLLDRRKWALYLYANR